jgi:hypothetical protein
LVDVTGHVFAGSHMSDMDDFVEVTASRKGKRISSGCYKLPFTVGRGEHNAVRIGHDPQDKTISRTHAVIQREGDCLRLIDKSSNGTIYRGVRMRQGNSVDLQEIDHFEIFEFKIAISRSKHNPCIPTIFEAHVLVDEYLKGKPFLIGEMLLLCFKTRNGYRFDHIPARANFETILSGHRIADEHAFAAVVGYQGMGRLLTRAINERPPILINKEPVRDLSVGLYPLDVVEIENIRIELFARGGSGLKCSNPTCQLLNPYDLTANCRFCSVGLVGAVTRSAAPKK